MYVRTYVRKYVRMQVCRYAGRQAGRQAKHIAKLLSDVRKVRYLAEPSTEPFHTCSVLLGRVRRRRRLGSLSYIGTCVGGCFIGGVEILHLAKNTMANGTQTQLAITCILKPHPMKPPTMQILIRVHYGKIAGKKTLHRKICVPNGPNPWKVSEHYL